MAEAMASIAAWWATVGTTTTAATTATTAAATTTAAGTAAAAGTATGLSAAAQMAIMTGVSAAGALASQALAPKPSKVESPPIIDATPAAIVKKKPVEPGNVPGSQNKNYGAGAAEERRRIMSNIPSAIKTTYAGNVGGPAPVRKKRLLGGGVSGATTTGGM